MHCAYCTTNCNIRAIHCSACLSDPKLQCDWRWLLYPVTRSPPPRVQRSISTAITETYPHDCQALPTPTEPPTRLQSCTLSTKVHTQNLKCIYKSRLAPSIRNTQRKLLTLLNKPRHNDLHHIQMSTVAPTNTGRTADNMEKPEKTALKLYFFLVFSSTCVHTQPR